MQLGSVFLRRFQVERLQYPAQQFTERMVDIGDQANRHITFDLVEQVANQGGFARAGLAGDDTKTCLVFQTILQQRDSHLMLLAQVEVGRIRQQGKGFFLQPVKRLIHRRYSPRPLY